LTISSAALRAAGPLPWLDEHAELVRQSLDRARQLLTLSEHLVMRSRLVVADADRATELLRVGVEPVIATSLRST
jgi:hypothetical protein